MSPHKTAGIEASIERADWVRGLARALVANEHEAEDLAQDAWLAAMDAGPTRREAWKSWFAGVLRNLARARFRGDQHRRDREREVAAREGVPGQDELVERLETHELLVRAVHELDEPYRGTILLRYFEGLTPKKIAERTGVPLRTVDTRLRRALQRLRERLDERNHGDRGAWVALLLPLARSRDFAVAGTLAMSLKLKIAFAAAAVLALVWVARDASRKDARAELPAPPPTLAKAAPPRESQQPIAESERVALEASASARIPDPLPALASAMRRGRVLDPNGNWLAGVRVGFDVERDPQPVVSGLHGEFEVAALDRTVVSLDERFATVLASRLDPVRAGPADILTVVVAPVVTLGGVVLDDHGAPVVGATVQTEIPLSFRGRFREALNSSVERWWCDCGRSNWANKTDEQGRFLLARVPGLTCAKVVARASHDRSASVPVPDHDDRGLELVLSAAHTHDYTPGPDSVHLLGEVRHADGGFASGALVSLDGVSTRADEQGLFELFAPPAGDASSGVPAGTERQLFAAQPGQQAAVFAPARGADSGELWPSFVRLRLGGAPKSIAGHVLGSDGQAIAKAAVWIEDLTFAGKAERAQEGRRTFLTLESQMAGNIDERAEHPWSCVYTDESGRFELTGLLDRPYTIAAMDPDSLQVTQAGPVAAGTRDVALRLAANELWERIAGHVVDSHGNPFVGLRVGPKRFTSHIQWGKSLWRELAAGTGVRTDDTGSFELERVPRSGITLDIRGDRFLPLQLELDEVADPLGILVEVPGSVTCRSSSWVWSPREERSSCSEQTNGPSASTSSVVVRAGPVTPSTSRWRTSSPTAARRC